jgi:hypothetical protein
MRRQAVFGPAIGPSPRYWDAVASKERVKMFRRIVLALTFVAALGAAGVGMVSKAAAHGGGCGYGGYGGYGGGYGGGYAAYNGYRNVYYGGYPTLYPSYYAAGYAYAPPVVAYPSGRRHHRGHHRHDRGGITFAIGF